MTKTRRAGFSKKRRRGGRKTVKRRGREQRTRVKRRGRKRSRRRRRRGGTTPVNNANTLTSSWKRTTSEARGQPDFGRHAGDVEFKTAQRDNQSYRPWYFDVTGSQEAVNKFKDAETKAGSATNTGENVDIYNWMGYYPDRGPDTSEMTSYMTKQGYGPVVKSWLGGPPGDNE